MGLQVDNEEDMIEALVKTRKGIRAESIRKRDLKKRGKKGLNNGLQ